MILKNEVKYVEIIKNHTNMQYLTVKRQKFEKSYTVSIF